MTNDPRFAGGGHEYGYASTQEAYEPHPAPAPYEPQPMARPAPQGFQPRPATPQPHALSQHATPYVPLQAPMPPAPVVAAAVARPDAQQPDKGVVELTRSYDAHDVAVKVVRFRKPTTKDLRKCGYPMRNVVNVGGNVSGIDEIPDIVARYITVLSDPPLPPSTVDQFELEDFSRCSAVIIGFFLD